MNLAVLAVLAGAIACSATPVCPAQYTSDDTLTYASSAVTSIDVTLLSGTVSFASSSSSSVILTNTRRATSSSLLDSFTTLSNLSTTGALSLTSCLDVRGSGCLAESEAASSSSLWSAAGSRAVSVAAAGLGAAAACAVGSRRAVPSAACASLAAIAAFQALPGAEAQAGYDMDSACNANDVVVELPDSWRGNIRVRATRAKVTVERELRVGSFEVSTTEGSVTSESGSAVEAYSCTITTRTGDVTMPGGLSMTSSIVAGSSRSLNVTTKSGDLDCQIVMPQIADKCVVNFKSVAGEISMGLGGFNGLIQLRTGGRNNVTVVSGTTRWTIDEPQYKNGTLGNSAGVHQLFARSASGKITATVTA